MKDSSKVVILTASLATFSLLIILLGQHGGSKRVSHQEVAQEVLEGQEAFIKDEWFEKFGELPERDETPAWRGEILEVRALTTEIFQVKVMRNDQVVVLALSQEEVFPGDKTWVESFCLVSRRDKPVIHLIRDHQIL